MPARNDDDVDDTATVVFGLELVDESVAARVVFVVHFGAVLTRTVVFIVVGYFIVSVVELRRFRNAERRIVVVFRDALEGHRVAGCGEERPEVERQRKLRAPSARGRLPASVQQRR